MSTLRKHKKPQFGKGEGPFVVVKLKVANKTVSICCCKGNVTVFNMADLCVKCNKQDIVVYLEQQECKVFDCGITGFV